MPPDGTSGLAFVAAVTSSFWRSRGTNAGSGRIGRIWSVSTSSLSFSTGWFFPHSMGGVARRTCRGLRGFCAAGVEDSAILDDHTVDRSALGCYNRLLFIVPNRERFTDLALILGCDTLSSELLLVPYRVSSTRMSLREQLVITLWSLVIDCHKDLAFLLVAAEGFTDLETWLCKLKGMGRTESQIRCSIRWRMQFRGWSWVIWCTQGR